MGSGGWELRNSAHGIQANLSGEMGGGRSRPSFAQPLPSFSEEALLGQSNNAVLTLKNAGNRRSSNVLVMTCAGLFQTVSLQQ